MAENRVSITALGTAYARAYHATHDSPKVFDDFLADQLFTPDEHTRTNEWLAKMLPTYAPDLAATNPDHATATGAVIQLMNGPITLNRSRYTEDALEEAVRQGVQQYVILGAGLDTFAFRRPDLLSQLQVFEVDHPATQAIKHERIAVAGWEIPPQLHFVPVDFNSESVATALQRSSFDPQKLTFFSWQGVTYYLTCEVVFATLQTVASIVPAGSTLIFDYLEADAFVPGKATKRTQFLQESAQRVGEPMKTGFDPLKLGDDLKPLGFNLQENLSPADIEARYFQGRTDRYHAFEQIYFARAVVA